MPLEERKEFCRSRMPVGSEFRGTSRLTTALYFLFFGLLNCSFSGVITKLCGNSVWLTMSKNANPKLRLDRSLTEPPFGSESSSTFKCPYRYLIMLDLEATCDYAPNPIVDVSTAEVTEFPWVVLDTQTGSIVYERQMFVRPDNLEAVTYYCTKLTGISQEMVRDGVKLQTALQLLDEYISSTFGAEDRGSFRIVTDGIWDLSIQLYTECKRKGIERPWYFSEYFDLKDCFCRAFPFFPPSFKPSLITLLNAVGLQVVGQHHRGLDDCKTIAQIVQLLLKLGFPFDNLKTVPSTPDYNPWQHPDFVDFGSRCEPDSWKCTTPDCGIWNRPWMYYCRFCDCRQTDQTLQKHLDASTQPPS
jgi:inhibitor of KinA sporulation pathway (predicted exonuclease)